MTVLVSGRDRGLDVVLVRSSAARRGGFDRSNEFSVNLSRVKVSLTNSRGGELQLRGSGFLLAQHERTATLTNPFSDSDAVRTRYQLPPDLPADLYDLKIASPDAAVGNDGTPLNIDFRIRVFVPAASSAELDGLRDRFLGKIVYARGQVGGNCNDGTGNEFEIIGAKRARIVAIRRLSQMIGISLDGTGMDPEEIDSLDPIEVTFAGAMPKADVDRILTSGRSVPPYDDTPRCPEYSVKFSGAWDFNRSLFLRPVVDPSWPFAVRSSVERGQATLGMTKRMVAAAWGYPSGYGTTEAMLGMNSWIYSPSMARQYAEVTFKAGRAVRIQYPVGSIP